MAKPRRFFSGPVSPRSYGPTPTYLNDPTPPSQSSAEASQLIGIMTNKQSETLALLAKFVSDLAKLN